jgi:hypothetical protein
VFGIDWNPLHLLKSLLKDATAPLSSIQKWVIKQLVRAAGLIENDIHKLAHAINSHLGGVENTLSFLAGQINNLAAAAGKDVGVSISWLTHEVDTLVGDAVGAAQKSLGALAKDAEGWLHDAESYADSAVSTFDRDVLGPALSGIHRAIHDIEAAPDKVWHDWLKDVWGPTDKVIHTAEVDAHSALHWVEHEGHDIAVLLDKCWDWLVWLGEVPLDVAENLPEQFAKRLPSVLTEAAAKPDKALWDKVIDELERELPHD